MAGVSKCSRSVGHGGDIYYAVDAKGSKVDGDPWNDGPGGHVRAICIRHEQQLIYSIQTTYERQGNLLCSRCHGGTEGNMDVITLTSPLTRVSGHYSSLIVDLDDYVDSLLDEDYNRCEVIRSLKFATADGATYGPYGCETGEPFDFRCSTGIAGFHGRSGPFHLNAIGVYAKSMAKGIIDDRLIDHRGASADVKSALPMSSGSTKLLDERKA